MPTSMSVVNDKYVLTYAVDGTAQKIIDFTTGNTFVEHDIRLTINTDTAGSLSASLSGSGISIANSASGGVFAVTATISGTVTPATAGWLATTGGAISSSSVSIGSIAQSTLKNGTATLASGSTVNPLATSQTINIGAGYEGARTVIIGPISAGPKGTITSGAATISTVSISDGSSTDTFNISGSATIAAPSVGTAGYVSNDSDPTIGGTKNTNTATLSATLTKIAGTTSFSGTTTYAPSISKVSVPSGVTNAATSDNATTVQPSSGVYIAVKSEANTGTLTATPSVTTDGYGTSTKHGLAAGTTTVGAAESSTTYIKIKQATISTPDTVATFTGPTYQSSGTNSGKFTVAITNNFTIDAPTITNEGYISSTIGTANTGTLTGTKVLNKITVGADVSGTTTLTHTLTKGTVGTSETWTNGASSGNVVTSAPASGVYIKVNAAALSTKITSNGIVTAAGYGTTSSGQYTQATPVETTVSAATANIYVPVQLASNAAITTTAIAKTNNSVVSVGDKSNDSYPISVTNLQVTANVSVTDGWYTGSTGLSHTLSSASTICSIPEATFSVSGGAVTVNTAGYVPADFPVTSLGTATFASTATTGVTYSTLGVNESEAPILTTGGGLYINAGYVGNTYISLARLVPDSISATNGFAPANYILANYGAFDANGGPIIGTMATYNGNYSIS